MPEVLRVIARLNVGGPARHVLRIEEPLRRRGWRSCLVTGRASAAEGDLVDEARAAGHEVVVLAGLRRAVRPVGDLAALAALRALIAERRPALLHTHTSKAGLLGRLAAPAALPCVHTFHGHVLRGYFPAPVGRALAGLERALARRSAALVSVSRAVRDELLHVHGVGRPAQHRVIPTGYDRERTAPDAAAGAALRAELGLAPDAVLFGCVGRLTAIKAPERLAAAWAAVAPRHPRAALLLVGDGERGPAVRRALAGLPRAHWRPPRRDLSAVWGAIDVAVVPSRAEGSPQVVLEALAAGRPVIASAVGGIPELLGEGRAGWLLPDTGVAPLVEALAALARDAGLRARLAAGAAARDLRAHESEAVGAALAALYDELAAPRLEIEARASQTARACISSS